MNERYFDVESLEGYEELISVLEEKGWMMLNNLIKETNKFIGLEFFTNVILRMFKNHISYVWGQSIDYNASRINALLHLLPPHKCSVQNRRNASMTLRMYERILEEFCQSGAQWVIINERSLRLHSRDICIIPRAWTVRIRFGFAYGL